MGSPKKGNPKKGGLGKNRGAAAAMNGNRIPKIAASPVAGRAASR